MLSTSPIPGVSGTKIEDAVSETLTRLSVAFDARPHLLPSQPSANYWRKALRGERSIALAYLVLLLTKAERAMGGASFVAYVLDPILALFGLEATVRGTRDEAIKTPAEESFDAHRTTVAAEHVFDTACADGEITDAERREINHRVTIAKEELTDLVEVAGGAR